MVFCYNFIVDVFLSADAQRTLQAVRVLSPAKCASGLLLGHKRAGRFFVETAFPAPAGFRPDSQNFPTLSANFQGRIIGFFLMGGSAADRRAFLQPLACGRCIVTVAPSNSRDSAGRGSPNIAKRNSHDIARREPGAIAFRAFAIDYDGRFRLDPINVIVEGKSAPGPVRGQVNAPRRPITRVKAPHSAPDKPATPRQKRSR